MTLIFNKSISIMKKTRVSQATTIELLKVFHFCKENLSNRKDISIKDLNNSMQLFK